MSSKNIGYNIVAPESACSDRDCPFHGTLKVRGRQFTGTVVSAKMQKTASVEWEWRQYIKKYQRYAKRTTRIKAHNPSCIDAREGELVMVIETRPLSKSKNFVIVQKVGVEKGYSERMRGRELAKKTERQKGQKTDADEPESEKSESKSAVVSEE